MRYKTVYGTANYWFFFKLIKFDSAVLTQISDFEGEVSFDQENGVFLFTLPDLHKLLWADHGPDYREFRSILYQGSINKQLRDIGATINIHHSTGKVDDTIYKLGRI